MNKRTCKLIAGMMTITFLSSASGGMSYRAKAESIGKDAIIKYIVNKAVNNSKTIKASAQFNDNLPRKISDPNEDVRVIVELQDKPLLQDETINSTTGNGLKAEISSKKKELDDQKSKQDKVIQKASQMKGAKVLHRYNYLVNGFSITLKRSELDKLRSIQGVKKVTEATVYKPDMTSAKNLTETYQAWKDYGLKGEGTVVAVIDTGIDYTHKDMKLSKTTEEKLSEKDVIIDDKDPGKYFSEKIPYGYNFADDNQDIIDRSTSMHGMHVAGIVAANGDNTEVKKNEAIQGVAPEAQLLAMKVFSNSPDDSELAYSDDIVAAIEASVTHGADVINMSIGSTAGFQDADDPEQTAIKNAVDKGVLVVTAAGNSYYSTYPSKYKGVVDTSTVDAPGTSKDALTVASYENGKIICSALDYTDEQAPIAYFTSEINPVGVLNNQYELVDCGLGQAVLDSDGKIIDEGDFAGKDLKGKIALIQRGSISFVDKKLNAQAEGAAGVIIYNSDGNQSYVSMVTDPEVRIPAIFIKNADGLKLKAGTAQGIKISFSQKMISVVNSEANDMSEFTSWGPTPNLDFKPQISAPGGNIYSTVNNNQYEVMSGTSMATPHVAGAQAIVMEALKKEQPELEHTRGLVDLAKASVINTAKVEMDKQHKDVPYSPRRQGAGLLQLDSALKNKVIVTDSSGSPTAALKQIGKNTTFDLILKNFSDKDTVYRLDNLGGAYTEIEQLLPTANKPTRIPYEVKIDGAEVAFDNSEVTVPAKGQAVVKVSINLPDTLKSEQFVEGFVNFLSEDGTVPNLVVPYIGFYGDWNKPLIIDNPMWMNSSVKKQTSIYSEIGFTDSDGNIIKVPIPTGITGLNENMDGLLINKDYIAFSPNGDMLFDDAVPVLEFLRNSKELNIEVLNSNKKSIRQIAIDGDITKDNYDAFGAITKPEWFWDGTLYNTKKGKYVTAPEGQYYIKVTSKIDFEDAKEQTLVMPVKLDLTAPEVNIVSPSLTNQSTYTLQWTANDASGIMYGAQAVLVEGQEEPVLNEIKFENGVYSCEVNLAEGNNKLMLGSLDNAGNIQTKEFEVTLDTQAPQKPKLSVDTSDYTNKNIEVTMDADQADDDVAFLEYSFDSANWTKYSEPFEVERNTMVYGRATDNAGNISETAEIQIKNIDKEPPKVEVEGVSNGAFYNGKVEIEVEIKDYSPTTKIMKLDGIQFNEKEKEVSSEGIHKLEVIATDAAGNVTNKTLSFTLDKTLPSIKINGVENGAFYNKDVTPEIIVNDATEITVEAKLDNSDYNGETITEEGAHRISVTATDAAKNKSEKVVSFIIDKTAPIVNIEGIEELGSYNHGVTPRLTVEDSSGTTVEAKLDEEDYEGQEITKEGQHKFSVIARDAAGNTTEKAINFTIDKTAPEVTIEGAEDGGLYNASVTLKVKVLDITEVETTTKLDGAVYDGQEIKQEGEHELTVTSIDAAGNKTEKTISFTIDTTKPIITIEGIADNMTYDNKAEAQISVNEGNLEVLLDGKSYSGEIINSIGSHELSVSAVDEAGNKALTTIRFTIRAVLNSNTSTLTDLVNTILASESKDITVALNGSTIISQDFFNAVANNKELMSSDKKLTFVINSNGMDLEYSFVLNEINPNNIHGNVDLSINGEAPNKNTITQLDSNSMIVSFKDNGVLPAPFTVKIKLASSKIDLTKPIYFYYYNPKDNNDQAMAGPLTADKDGYVQVTINHCSDYFFSNLIIEKKQEEVPANTGTPSIPKLGSAIDENVLISLGTLLSAAGLAVLIFRRRKKISD